MAKIVDICVSEQTLELLRKRRIRTSLKLAQNLKFADDCAIEPYSGIFRGNSLPRRAGAFTYSNSPFHFLADYGRYCSIAAGVSVMGNGHPHSWVSISPFSYGSWRVHENIADAIRDSGQLEVWNSLPFRTSKGAPVIKNDVWIGQDALLAQGITIGDGAIIAARAVVTKDVEPYTIVGGSPARVLRRRFPDALIDRLNALRWWEFRFTDFTGMSFDRPEVFADELENRIATGHIDRYQPNVLTAEELRQSALD